MFKTVPVWELNCVYMYHNYIPCSSNRTYKYQGLRPWFIESCSYCYRLHTLKHSCQQLYHNGKIFAWYGVCATSCTTFTTTAWKKEVSLLQFQMSTPPPLLGQCYCRCMHVVLSLSVAIHNLYTLFYLLCTYNAWKKQVVWKCSLATWWLQLQNIKFQF